MISREIRIMIKCQHPTIIKFHGYSLRDFNQQKNAMIFMELAKNGSLMNLIQKVKSGLLEQIYDNTNRQIILVGISRGMMHLHQHKIMHRDLKPGNVLIDENLHPRITDFGLSKIDSNGSASQSQQCGTSIYMAPEVIEGNHYGLKADVYSFGILMYEVVTDLTPYPLFEKGKMSSFQFNNKVVNEDMRPKFSIKVKKSIQKLIEKCWSKNPSERPSFEELFKKLAYNEDSENDEVLNIDDEDDDDDVYKYYLDGVDADEVIFYADEIDLDSEKQSDSIDQLKISEIVESLINPIKKENASLKLQIEQMQKEKDEMINRIELLEKALKNKNDNSVAISRLNEKQNVKNTHITIKEFNNLSLDEQQSIASCLCEGQMNQYFTNLNSLLLLLIKFLKPNESNFIVINSENEEQFLDEIKEEKEIQICSTATEKLSVLNLLNSPDLNSIILNFNRLISFEVKFNTQLFENIYLNLVEKKNKMMIFNIIIFINDEKFTSRYFRGKTAINSVKFSSNVKAVVSDGFFTVGSFALCSNLTRVQLPSSLQIIGESTFESCSSLVEIKIPKTVKCISMASFCECIALKSVLFEDIENSSLIIIGYNAFNKCRSLEEITIPPSVQEIQGGAFANCTSLKTITIPKSVKEIGDHCFYECSSLKTIEVSLSSVKIGKDAFPLYASLIDLK